MTKNTFKSSHGFSLVELMVVVGIIGILATIAVPNFRKFQANAKVAVVKSEMTTVYTALVANFQETGAYNKVMGSAGSLVDLATDGSVFTASGSSGGLELSLPTTNRFYSLAIGMDVSLTIFSTNCSENYGTHAQILADVFTIGVNGCPYSSNTRNHVFRLTQDKEWFEIGRYW